MSKIHSLNAGKFFMLLCLSADFFSKFQEHFQSVNSLDPDLDQHLVAANKERDK